MTLFYYFVKVLNPHLLRLILNWSIYSGFSVNLTWMFPTVNSLFSLCSGFLEGCITFLVNIPYFCLWKFDSGQCLMGFLFCSDVYVKSVTSTLCVDWNFLSAFSIPCWLNLSLTFLLMNFLISLLEIFFLFKKEHKYIEVWVWV